MMNNNTLETCSVCSGIYDEALHRPHLLPCGHSFCTQCMIDALMNGQVTCNSCHTWHMATSAVEFPISYDIEALIKKFKSAQVTPEGSVPAKLCQPSPNGVSKKLLCKVEEQINKISSLITNCEEALCQLGEYRGQLRDWKTHHYQLQHRLYGLVEQNKAAIRLLETEDTSVVGVTTQGEAGKKHLQSMLESLKTVSTTPDTDRTLNKASECSGEAEGWLQKCQKLFPDANTVNTSLKVQESVRDVLETITAEAGVTPVPVQLEETASTVMEKVQRMTGRNPLNQLTVGDLRRKISDPIKRLVDSGRLLAIPQDQNDHRSAMITLQDGQLYLHPLMHRKILHSSQYNLFHFLQHSDIMGMLDPVSTMVFLDFGWAGSVKGRVTIRLFPDIPLSKQFLLLCTGLLGPTYINTNLLLVGRKGHPGEWIEGGDYERNNGEGGASLLPEIWGESRQSSKAGDVWARWLDHRSAQFAITTRDRPDRWTRVFGEIVSGLKVVRAAAKHVDITKVSVVDCGVVLPV
ncbi:uncharacterized protein [Procambarus clarkii]|uniref:uncharacterized protein isoform X2 n=1 Tax=Procambarus clarkii TaxID=6728 RepID=UPI001E677BA5|nr:uncharacterized protein LOC123763843 [Procambarus clarkii]XP_045607115.1 uncharacterized protein LOC123763843 [Procambarus clarkii]